MSREQHNLETTRQGLAQLREDAVDEARLQAAREYVRARTAQPERALHLSRYALAAAVLLAALFVVQQRWPRAPQLPPLPVPSLNVPAPEVARWELPAKPPPARGEPSIRYVADTEIHHDDGTTTTDAILEITPPNSTLKILWMVPELGDD